MPTCMVSVLPRYTLAIRAKPLYRESGGKISSCLYVWLIGVPMGGALPYNALHSPSYTEPWEIMSYHLLHDVCTSTLPSSYHLMS